MRDTVNEYWEIQNKLFWRDIYKGLELRKQYKNGELSWEELLRSASDNAILHELYFNKRTERHPSRLYLLYKEALRRGLF